MNFLDYFEPLTFSIEPQKGYLSNNWTFLSAENAEKLKIKNYSLALITISTENNDIFFKEFRNIFYQLANHTFKLYKAIDLGCLKKTSTFSDTLYATRDVVEFLLEQKVCPIIISDNQYIPYAIYLAYEVLRKHVSIGAAEAIIHVKKNKNHYLPQILSKKDNTLFNYTILGYQNYFCHPNEINALNTLYFDHIRLGDIQADITQTEPYIRECDTFFFHASSLKHAFLPQFENTSDNGLTVKEACQIARYAGFADKLSSFSYLFDSSQKQNPLSLAEIIWHFVDGFFARKHDYPAGSIQKLTKFHVEVSTNNFITFFKSPKSNRWWMEIPLPKTDFKKKWLVACSENDYLMACSGIVPDKWYYSYQKVM
ncbi:MAG TPA: hypothetical protein PKG63_01925 [Bacteroidales bacterium]|nr:hypothetical protein [Bacteroidales bacterium]HNV95205.1 hypothetical protein [Bacteroidales bacterium]HOU99231.1 hypothetical protein [Bacteroidales bacterium]